MVPISLIGDDFYRNRDGNGNVRLNRRNNARSPKGNFRCSLPNSRGVMVHLHIFVYAPDGEFLTSGLSKQCMTLEINFGYLANMLETRD